MSVFVRVFSHETKVLPLPQALTYYTDISIKASALKTR